MTEIVEEDLDSYPFPLGPLGEPPERFSELRAQCPVVRVRMPSGDTAWAVTGYDEVVAALSDSRLSRAALREPGAPRVIKGPDFGDNPFNLLSQDGADHRRLRRLISPAFTPKRAEQKRPRIQEIADELVDALEAGPRPADLHHDFAALLPIWVITDLLGASRERRADIQRWTDHLVSITAHTADERLRARDESAAYVVSLLAERRGAPGEDLLSDLITARDDGDRLSEQELVWLTVNLLVAGHDTTVSALSRATYQILRHQDQWASLVARVDDREVVRHAVDELLRYAPPSEIGFLRIATDDLEVGGVAVRKGEGVIPIMHAAGRDTRHVHDPDRLDLFREDVKHVAFGHGSHFCPGAGLARLELEIGLATLARRLPELQLAVPPDDVEWSSGLLTLRPKTLPARW
ncbi:cytochrome P450 [Nocardia sp. NPDC004168]|uniref:cytochrome P450 n=1 Tax=Nocardia TaxID=1817 RepID=UPI0033B526D3